MLELSVSLPNYQNSHPNLKRTKKPKRKNRQKMVGANLLFTGGLAGSFRADISKATVDTERQKKGVDSKPQVTNSNGSSTDREFLVRDILLTGERYGHRRQWYIGGVSEIV